MSASNRGRTLLALPIALFVAFGLTLSAAGSSTATTISSGTTQAGIKTLSVGNRLAHHERRRAHRLDAIRVARHVAKRQLGDMYSYGADGPNQFDCSGLIQYSFNKAGITLPRTSNEQYRGRGRNISHRNMKKGDLLFFLSGGSVYHAGIYWGRNRQGERTILHASRTGTPVKRDPIWTNDYRATTLRVRH